MNMHIIHNFDDSLFTLKDQLISMKGQTMRNLERSARAVAERDADLASAVIGDDSLVDDFEVEIERMGLALLARFHPVSSDLRFVLASMKVSANLERISDHAVNMAKRARKMSKHPKLPEVRAIAPLAEGVVSMVRDSAASFVEGNPSPARSLGVRDAEADKLYKSIVSGFSIHIEQGDPRSESFLHLVFIARSLERIGELAVNIGENTVFMKSSGDIHHAEENHNLSAVRADQKTEVFHELH